jgi:hypothetical protein
MLFERLADLFADAKADLVDYSGRRATGSFIQNLAAH